MKPFEFTPSAGPRLLRCIGGAVLSNVSEDYASAERGRALHDFMRSLALGVPRGDVLAAVPEDWREDAERIAPVEDVASGRPEVGLALDLTTGEARALGEDMTREEVRAAKPPGSIGMLLDWLSVETDTAVVRDWKMGWQEDLGAATEHLQLRAYVATALLALGKPKGRGELWHWDGIRWRVDVVEMDWLGAQEALDEVRGLVARVEAARDAHARRGELPRLAVGRWCTWCPAQRACPALTGGLVAVLRGEVAGGPVAEMTPEEAGRAYETVRQLRTRLDGFMTDLEMLASRTPLPLPDGKELRLQEVERMSVDVDAAAPLLSARFGSAVPDAATKVRRSMSWEGLGDALRIHALPAALKEWQDGGGVGRKPTLARMLDQTRAELERAWAVRVSVFTSVRPSQPRLGPGVDGSEDAEEVPPTPADYTPEEPPPGMALGDEVKP